MFLIFTYFSLSLSLFFVFFFFFFFFLADLGEDGQQNGEEEIHKACDIIRITGQREQCEAAKHALLSLVPITLEVGIF
jgi:hypothetical protein